MKFCHFIYFFLEINTSHIRKKLGEKFHLIKVEDGGTSFLGASVQGSCAGNDGMVAASEDCSCGGNTCLQDVQTCNQNNCNAVKFCSTTLHNTSLSTEDYGNKVTCKKLSEQNWYCPQERRNANLECSIESFHCNTTNVDYPADGDSKNNKVKARCLLWGSSAYLGQLDTCDAIYNAFRDCQECSCNTCYCS